MGADAGNCESCPPRELDDAAFDSLTANAPSRCRFLVYIASVTLCIAGLKPAPKEPIIPAIVKRADGGPQHIIIYIRKSTINEIRDNARSNWSE